MAQIAMPRQQVTQDDDSGSMGTPLYQRRSGSFAGPIELVPNRDFVFPLPSPESAPTSLTTSSAGVRRPRSLQPPSKRPLQPSTTHKSVSALPDFNFNPSASPATTSLQPPLMATPPQSPLPTTPTTPSRNIGHRRGGSEFIGGDSRSGGTGLLSSSPTKAEGALPPPNPDFKFGPPAGRRGHAHRRSGAISSHDLSTILQPKDANSITASAPVSPMDQEMKPFQGHTANRSLSQPSLRSASHEENMALTMSDSGQRRPLSRARVGFSDRVEYIRPLSTISSETESSLSTVRGHSVSNSLSSVISAGAPSPPSSRMQRPSLNTAFENDTSQPRPSTAGAVLDMKERGTNVLGNDLTSFKRPMSAISPNSPVSPISTDSPLTSLIPHKARWSFRPTPRRSDVEALPVSASSSEPSLTVALESPLPSPSKLHQVDDGFDPTESSQATQRKTNRKPRKVKSWASAIISLKPKHPIAKPKLVAPRPPTPPPARENRPQLGDPIDLDLLNMLDVDDTVTIVTPPANEASKPSMSTDYTSWMPKDLSSADSDSMSPVIDLDAALGPFNTPNAGSRALPARGPRRQLHSGSYSVGVFGSNMMNHRRTESAPELVPFEFRKGGMTSHSTMADVFEEEEEEEEANHPSSEATTSLLSNTSSIEEEKEEDEEEEEVVPNIEVVESADPEEQSEMKFDFDDGLRIRNVESLDEVASDAHLSATPAQSNFSESSPLPLTGKDTVEVVEDHEEPRTSSLTRSSDSTVTPTMTNDDAKEQAPAMNLSLPLSQQTVTTPDTCTSSSFSSPSFSPTGTSVDTPRLGTAASSVTDRGTLNSMILGEPGPEYRGSVDDVPSLTSSRSTMTSGLHHSLPVFMPRSQGGDRSSSISSGPSIISERRRKRSSIASLSRLMGGSFGERSKLSIEQRPQSSHDEIVSEAKPKKAKRLSRLMHFWKPKEATNR